MDIIADGVLVDLVVIAAAQDHAGSASAVVGAIRYDVMHLIGFDIHMTAGHQDADSYVRTVGPIDVEALNSDVVTSIEPDRISSSRRPDHRGAGRLGDVADGRAGGATGGARDRLVVSAGPDVDRCA